MTGRRPNFLGRNAVPADEAGYARVRNGFAGAASAPVNAAGSRHIGGFSVRPDNSDEFTHHVFRMSTSTGLVSVRTYDEYYRTLLCATDWGYCPTDPPRIHVAHVAGQVVVGARGLPLLWGYAGVHPRRMVSPTYGWVRSLGVESVPPSGPVVGWAGRLCAADNEFLLFSDPLLPRAFSRNNRVNVPGGRIVALHVGAEGTLFVCCSDGVWALPRQAAAAGQLVNGIFTQVSDHPCTEDGTATALGRVWGLTADGIRLIDTADDDGISILEPRGPLRTPAAYRPDNLRQSAKLIGADGGLWVVPPESNRSCWVDPVAGSVTWCELLAAAGAAFEVCATMADRSGRQLALLSTPGSNPGPELVAWEGVRDDDDLADGLWGGTIVRERSLDRPDLREIEIETDGTAVRLGDRSARDSLGIAVSHTEGAIVGTTNWAAPGSVVHASPERLVGRVDRHLTTRDLLLEVQAAGAGRIVATEPRAIDFGAYPSRPRG